MRIDLEGLLEHVERLATLAQLLRAYGSKPAAEVLAPAISLAEEGGTLTPLQHGLLGNYAAGLRKGNAGAIFLDTEGNPWPAGFRLRQPALAKTLHCLAREGIEDFYLGALAQIIHADMQNNNGFIHKDYLANIPYPIERDPLKCRSLHSF